MTNRIRGKDDPPFDTEPMEWRTLWRKPVGADDLAFERAGDYPDLDACSAAVCSHTGEAATAYEYRLMPYLAAGRGPMRTPLPREEPELMRIWGTERN